MDRLEGIKDALKTLDAYPVMSWTPTLCGQMDMVIKADGSWWHEGQKIMRSSMVDLFSKLLKKEGDDYFLVTPLEKLKISVVDLPLIIVDIDPDFMMMTGQGQRVKWGEEHALCFDGDAQNPKPRLHIRHDLWARFNRNAYYRLMDLAQISEIKGAARLNFGGHSFDLKT